ncbi:MAG: hypothetical protein HY000_17940 [Planctomycetes bacterium]|nr:hypothetical protein [Planctomycetota bacterium]
MILGDFVELLEAARRTSARAVNAVMTTTYWEIGRRIVEIEMRGQGRADYGKQLISRLAVDLTARFGRGFGRASLYQMRGFYLAYPGIVWPFSPEGPVNCPIADWTFSIV